MDRKRFYPEGVDVFPDHYSGSLMSRWEKIVLHSIESYKYYPSNTSYYGHQLWPHETLARNDALGVWELYNHLPLERTSACMRNLAGGVETNRDGCVQIEIAWVAGQGQFLPQQALDLLAEWVIWVNKETGIPLDFVDEFHFYPPENGYRLGKEPWRLRGEAFDKFRGIIGHQHADENVHGDPGKIDVNYLRSKFKSPTGRPIEEMRYLLHAKGSYDVFITDFITKTYLTKEDLERVQFINYLHAMNGIVWLSNDGKLIEWDPDHLKRIPTA